MTESTETENVELNENTDEQAVEAEAEAEAAGESKSGRGRPRPDAVVQRDEQVWDYLASQRDENGAAVGKTREEVATATGLAANQVYLSFYRLKRDGRITKGGAAGAQKWSAILPDAPQE